jgi:hypothetical protein
MKKRMLIEININWSKFWETSDEWKYLGWKWNYNNLETSSKNDKKI